MLQRLGWLGVGHLEKTYFKEKSHVSLVGKNYVTIPMSSSWERVTVFCTLGY